MADLSLYVDVTKGLFVQSEASLQPLRSLDLIQGAALQVNVEFMQESGNGLVPFVNIDPTEFDAQFGIGYVNTLGQKVLIAYAATTAFSPTAISAMSGAQTALTFYLNLATSAASALLSSVHSSPMWAELLWDGVTAITAGLQNKAQVAGTIKTGYLGVGLTFGG